MKNKSTSSLIIVILLAVGIIFGCGPAHAQTVTTNQVPNLMPNTPFTLAGLFSGGVSAGIKAAGQGIVNFVEGTTNNGVVTVEAGGLYGLATKKAGGFIDAYLPVAGTNSVFGAGVGVYYFDGNAGFANLSARLGDTFTVPFVRIPLYAYAEAGPAFNLNSPTTILAQTFTGACFKIPLTLKSTVTFGGAVGSITGYAGNILAFGGSYTFSW